MAERPGPAGSKTEKTLQQRQSPTTFEKNDDEQSIPAAEDSTESDAFAYTYNDPQEAHDKTGKSEIVTSSKGYFDYKTYTDVENIVFTDDSIPYNPVTSSEGYFDCKTHTDVENIVNDSKDSIPYYPEMKDLECKLLKRMLLNERVPAILCLVNTTGLPKSFKSATVLKMLKSSIGDKDLKSEPVCLAANDLTILSRHPTQPKGYTWKTSKRCGIAYFVLSHLVRCDALHDQQFRIKHIPDEQEQLFDDPVLNQHFHWVYKDASENYNSLLISAGTRQLFRSGVSLIRIWDADGANKAIHEFQRIVSGHFTRSLRLAFFCLDRDTDKFNEPLDASLVKYRPICHEQTRLQHLLNTAAPSGNESLKGAAVMVATTQENTVDKNMLKKAKEAIMKAARDQHIDHVIHNEFLHGCASISQEELREQQKVLEKAAYYNLNYTVNVPLKWIFLRSALAGEKKPKLFVKIAELRILANELEFSDTEFENFLVTFTSFGSILYCPEYPPLKDHILTDIPKFCELLDRLCYPEDISTNRSKYGIITKREVSNVLEGFTEDVIDHFTKVLLSLGMTAKVPNGRLKGCRPFEEGYFLPCARISTKADTQFLQESVYIVVTSNHNPLDIQATLVRSILKEIERTSLVVSTLFNTSCFSYGDSDTHLTLVFHYNSVEIRLKTSASIDKATLERLQFQVLLYCSYALDRHSDHNKSFQWYIGLACTAVTSDKGKPTFHSIEREVEDTSCTGCKNNQTAVQKSWIRVTEKHLKERISYHDNPKLTEMSSEAEKLSVLFKEYSDKSSEPSDAQQEMSKKFADFLGLTQDQVKMTAGLTGSDKIMMMLLLWKQTRKAPMKLAEVITKFTAKHLVLL